MQTKYEIKVGDVGILTKAKHRWNNGKQIIITKIDTREDCYHARSTSDSKEMFVIGQRNFQPVEG